MSEFRFGTIGTSMICDNLCHALEEVDRARLSVVFSRHEDTARAFAEKHGADRYVTSIDELAAAADELAAWQQATLDSLFITDQVRAQAGVVFPSDEA